MLIEIGCGHTSQGKVPSIMLVATYGIGRSVAHGVEGKGPMGLIWGSAANEEFRQNGFPKKALFLHNRIDLTTPSRD